MLKHLVGLTLCCFVISIMAQSPGKLLEEYAGSHHTEKLYIHHNQDIYTPGDTIWAKVYFVEGRTHQFFSEASPLVHVEWYNFKDSLVTSLLLKIDKGIAEFDIPLAYDTPPGEYHMKAYTNYQRNFDPEYSFQKSIQIIGDLTQEKSKPELLKKNINYSVSFYPEGGNIIEGLKNKVAFKAQNFYGENIQVEGVLIDGNENEISKTKTYVDGIGYFEFIPLPGQSYRLVTRHNDIEKKFDIPSALPEGYVLSADSKHKEFIILQTSTNTNSGLNNCSIIGHVRGQLVMEQPLSSDVNEQTLKIPRSELPSGIIHFTLFDDERRPRCERLVFNKSPLKLENPIDISSDKPIYRKRETVTITVSELSDLEERIESSLAVISNNLIPQSEDRITIENYLLIQSELKGRIPNINQYFRENTTKSNFYLDLVMMTHGWSRFTWTDVLNKNVPPMEFGVKDEIQLVGLVSKKGKPIKTNVFVSALNSDGMTTAVVESNNEGIFVVEGLEFKDTMDVIMQASESENKKKSKQGEFKRSNKSNVDIELLTLEKPSYDKSLSLQGFQETSSSLNQIIGNFKENRRLDSLYNPTWMLELDEFYVSAQKKTKREVKLKNLKKRMQQSGMFYFPSSQKIFLDDLPGGGYQYQNIFDIVRGRAPGVRVDGSGGDRFFVIRETVNISGSIPALVLVDGAEISRPADIVISPDNILAIDIVKGLSSAAAYGERGAGGVISIITKNPEEAKENLLDRKPKGTLKFTHSGIYNKREYYTPNYAVRSIDHQRPDLRTCLYWAPSIDLKNGNAELKFYTGDKPGKYTVYLEGITESGHPFTTSYPFEVME